MFEVQHFRSEIYAEFDILFKIEIKGRLTLIVL
jgi:hypothetical protein